MTCRMKTRIQFLGLMMMMMMMVIMKRITISMRKMMTIIMDHGKR